MKEHKGHLTIDEREKIYLHINKGLGPREIGRIISRDHGVVSRELERNKGPDGKYSPNIAEDLALKRRTEANTLNPRVKDEGIWDKVKKKLQEGWSPEQIAGRLKLKNNDQTVISPETIYQYIYREDNKNLKLWVHLRQNQPKRRKREGRKVKKEIVPNRIFIDERPAIINEREEIGHWESDLIIGKNDERDAISVNTERKTKFVVLSKLLNKTAKEKKEKTITSLGKLPPWLRKSITYDNGSENAKHEEINTALNLKSYFCYAYHSWEKGTVENTNGLLREYFPKRSSFQNLEQRDLNLVATILNNRPRKCLGYQTPYEVLSKELSGAF